MSTEDTFEQQLEQMYQRYRREHLRDRLDALAQDMEETLLHKAVAKSFFGEDIHIDSDVKQSVASIADELAAENYELVEQELDEVEREINRVETRVTNRIQELRIDREETVSAMRRLNERVERVDPTQVESLESLLDEWDWKPQVYLEGNDTFEQRHTEAIEYGEDMQFIFEMLKDELFGAYDGTELRPIVDKLLDDERLRLGHLSETERQQLANSDLSEYVELKLS